MYAGAALTALATVLLSVTLARISAVVVGSRWQFAAGWIALAGLWAGGLLGCVLGGSGGRRFSLLARLAAASAVSVLGSLALVLNHAGAAPSLWLGLAGGAPFVLAGVILAVAAAESGGPASRAYLFSLLGAAGGFLLAVGLLDWLGGPNAAIGAAVLSNVSAALWFTLAGSRRGRAVAVIAALCLVAVVAFNARRRSIDVRYARGEPLRGERFVKWNSYSRVAVDGFEPGRLALRLDAEHAGYLAGDELDEPSPAGRLAVVRRGLGLPYLLRPGAKTLILNAGGGEAVVLALGAGSHDVTGVETNPIVANTVMRRNYTAFTRGLYLRPEVRIVVQDARSFVQQSRELYQVLHVLPLRAGAAAQPYLLTAEAFFGFLERLTEDGLLAVSLPRCEPALSSLVAAPLKALERLGAREPGDHVIVVRDRGDPSPEGAADTVIVSRRPLSPVDLERCRRIIDSGPLMALYLPGVSADINGSFHAVAPPTDNRPFLTEGTGVHAGVRALGIASLAAVAATLGLAAFRAGKPARGGNLAARRLPFFVFTGAGFLLFGTPLAAQLSLFVGHPSAKLTVIAPALVASAGLGALAGRSSPGSSHRNAAVLAAVALLAAALSMLVAPLASFGAGWPLGVKAVLAVLIASPAGVLMGMAAAAGFAWLDKTGPAIAWAWTLHAAGAMSGAALAALLSVRIGLREALLAGGLAYLGAWLAAGGRARPGAGGRISVP